MAVMRQGSVADLDAGLALCAAAVGLRPRLPLADSIVHATAHRGKAVVWTQDGDFEGLPGVRYFSKH
jgi:predicted nucleic acid-binding protein